MTTKTRTVKIWVSLVASMTVGAIVLMALDNQKISAPAFSLSSFQKLANIERSLNLDINTKKADFRSIEVGYTNTIGGNIENIALAQGNTNPANADFHFLIGNGDGASDGEIISTNRWKNQKLLTDKSLTIKVLVVSDGVSIRPTDTQVKRLSSLLNTLVRKFDIKSEKVNHPKSLEL